VSDEPIGVEEVHVTPDGERIVWWHDPTGDERGHWVVQDADGGAAGELLPGVPDGWAVGIAMEGSVVAVGISTDDDYRVYLARDGAPAALVYRHEQPAGVGREWGQGPGGGLSADGSILCIRHCEHGDLLHPALRALDTATGEPIGDVADAGRRLDPAAWSPVPGDHRIAVVSQLGPFERPALWNPRTDERTELAADDLPGAVFPIGWYPDGSALLVRHEHDGVDELDRLDLASGRSTPAASSGGEILDAAVRPDGHVWLHVGDSVHAPRVVDESGEEVLAAEGERAPDGRPFRSYWFDGPGGRVQAWVVTPEGDAPFPTVMYAHGGPEWHQRDGFDPEIQALVDHGFAVAMVNYRGSTGYGVAFRETLVRNIGFPESEDLLACLDALTTDGTADPGRAFLAGWSWGGYLGCLAVGLHPERYRAVFAGIPTGDYVDAHEHSSPPLQAWDVAMMGGHPADVPDLYRERDPMTYVRNGTAPVLIIAGRNDSRCPFSSAEGWAEAYRRHGGEVRMHVYDAGHHSNGMAEQVLHARLVSEFFLQHL
jgi:dipeptidyl aminopeptidase/acylaminoacyl peptidase